MKSKVYFAVVLVLCAINTCNSQELKIKKLQRCADGKLNLCFETTGDILRGDIKYYQLVIIDTNNDPVVERPVINEAIENLEDSKCFTFGNSELNEYDGKEGTYFILTGRDEDDMEVVFGTAQINMPNFPENGADSVTAYYVGTPTDRSLRVNDHTRPKSGETWSVSIEGQSARLNCQYPKDGSEDSTKAPCFVISGLESAGVNLLTMCIDVKNQLQEDETVNICGNKFKPSPFQPDGPSMNEVSLDYTLSSLDLDASPEHSSTKIDIIFYNDKYQQIYVNQNLKSTVTLENYEPVFKTYNILLVGLQAKQVKESSLKHFQDFKVVSQELAGGSGIIEVQWKKTTEVEQYGLTRSTILVDDGGSFKETTVNCPGDGDTFCYGYFVQLVPGDYFVTFKPFKDGIVNSNNGVISKAAKITTETKAKVNKITINKTSITWNIQNEAAVKICFHYTNDSKFIKNNYEVIIINNKGQWRRDTKFLEADAGIVCSMGITLPSEQFKRNSVLTGAVIKRPENGFGVIESGYAVIELS